MTLIACNGGAQTAGVTGNNESGGMINFASEKTITTLASLLIDPENSKTKFYENDSNHKNYFIIEIDPLNIKASIDYHTEDGSAIAGNDYIAASGKIIIPAGTTSVQIAVEIIGDSISEADETFNLIIDNPVNGIFPGNVTELMAIHTIKNDDYDIAPPSVDNTPSIAKNLASNLISGIPPILDVESLSSQPDAFSDTLLVGLLNAKITCPQSGTFEFTFTDVDNDKKYASSNDKFAIELDQCNDGNTSSHGGYTLTLNTAITNATEKKTGTEVELDNLSITDGTTQSIFTGVLQTTITEPLNGIDPTLIGTTSSQLQLDRNERFIFTVLDAQVSNNIITNEKSITGYDAIVTLSNSNTDGQYKISVVDTLKIIPLDNYPYTGTLKIERLDGTINIVITVLDQQQVRLETDTNGDNKTDYEQDVLWSDLSTAF